MIEDAEKAGPITHGGVDYIYKECECSKCGDVRTCTPSDDFYTVKEDGLTGPLYCEACFKVYYMKILRDRMRK